ncbi:MAG: flagellar hook-associated protein FlgK [Gammaproteobacteria bacterium]|nr:MAG: flagellar hook-associated protein FlgK [Gammaproteobacteria bacterium]
MSSGLLGVATSGLLAFQRSLTTTSHNIANVNTDGYSRQRVDFGTRPAQATGAGFIGKGVDVTAINRAYDDFLTLQVRSSTSSHSELNGYYQLASQVDNFIANENTGMSAALQDFFNAVQEVADDPTSIPARQVMLSEANILTDRFNALNSRFTALQSQVNKGTEGAVAEINNLAASIADLNAKIVVAYGASGGNAPNDLLDQRDFLITQLSEKVDVSTVSQQDGAINVFIGNGQTLVMATTAAQLSTQPNATDPTQLDVMFSIGGAGLVNISQNLTGGELGGTMRFRNEILTPATTALDDIAAQLATDFNTQHALGWDLNGAAGGNLFTVPPAVTSGYARTMSVLITDPAEIAASGVNTAGGAVGNNQNVLALADLQSAKTMLAGTASFHDAYSRIVADVGSKTHAAGVNQAAQKGLLDHAVSARDSLSGVNLDEEAANLLKFQQAYQASAQVISVSNSLFETLLGAFR